MSRMVSSTLVGNFNFPKNTADPWINLDGRLNAPAKSPQLPNILNTYHPGGTPDGRYFWPSLASKNVSTGNLMQPPWHVAGVDYAVGIRPAALPLKDPQTITDPGVTVNPTSIVITGNNVTLQGYDFSLAGGYDVDPQAANTTFLDCNFKTGTNAKPCIYANGGTPSGLTVKYCELDGSFIDTTPQVVIGNNGSSITIQYCLLKNAVSDQVNSNVGGAIDIRFNVFQSSGTLIGHPDVLQIASGNYGPNLWNFNLIYQPVNASQDGGSQGVFWDGNPTWALVSTTETAYNTVIALNGAPNNPAAMGPWFSVVSANLSGGATATVHDNFGDPTATSPGWAFATSSTYNAPSSTVFNNINMLDGTLFPHT